MKKWLIGIVLLLGIVIMVKQLVDSGNYQAFCAAIKEDVAKGNKLMVANNQNFKRKGDSINV